MNRAHQQLAAAVVQVWKMHSISLHASSYFAGAQLSIMMLYSSQGVAQTARRAHWVHGWRAAVARTPHSAHVSLLYSNTYQGLLKAAKSNLAAGICVRCNDASALLRCCWLECEKCEKKIDSRGGVLRTLPEEWGGRCQSVVCCMCRTVICA